MSYQETKGMQCISRITFIFLHTLYMQLLKNCSCETYKTTDHILNEALPQRNAVSACYLGKTHYLPGFFNTAFTVTVAFTEKLFSIVFVCIVVYFRGGVLHLKYSNSKNNSKFTIYIWARLFILHILGD